MKFVMEHKISNKIQSKTNLSMNVALVALRIIVLPVFLLISNNESRLNSQTPRAANQIVPVQEPQSIIEPLLAHIRKDLRFRGKENPCDPVNVALRNLNTRIGNVYVEELRGVVPRADIALPAERADRYGILVQSRQIVAESAVHVPDAVKLGRNYSREDRDESRSEKRLHQVFPAVVLGNDYVLPVTDSS